MSSHPPTNENLSAYFDHEASPEERQELETLLEHSAEARQELHEMGEVSRLLQETATESAPPELAASIRRRIEQETLLTETTPASVNRAPSLLRYRIAVAISTCSSLAALILFVLLMNTPETSWNFQATSTERLAYQPAPESGHDLSEILLENKPEVRLSSSTENPFMPSDKAMPAPPSVAFDSGSNRDTDKPDMKTKKRLVAGEPTTNDFKGDFSVRNTIAEKKVAATPPKSAMAVLPHSSGIPSHIPLDTIRIGDALPYFSDIDGKVAVIEVRVVDVKQALGTMELLLARNNIPVNPKKQSAVERQLNRSRISKAKDARDAKPTVVDSDAAKNELFAVYVEATDAQLASALKDFQKDLQGDQFVGLTLQPAIKASSLTDGLEELPQLLAQRSNFSESKNVKGLVAGASVRRHNQKPAAPGSSKKDAALKESVVADSLAKKGEAIKGRQYSYQMRYRMQLPEEQRGQRAKLALQNDSNQKAGKKVEVSKLPALVASKPKAAATNKAPEKEATQNQAPVKVLFVFKDAVTTTTSPAPQ